jgi:hypothetical protein
MRFAGWMGVLWLLVSCSSSPVRPTEFDYGKIENGVYQNRFFNLKIPVPEGWDVQSAAEMAELDRKGFEMIRQKNETLSQKIKASEVTAAKLFTVFRYDTDSLAPLGYNPSIMCSADNLAGKDSIRSGADYLDIFKESVKEAKMGFQIAPDYERRRIGDENFYVLRLTRAVGEMMDITQLYMTTVKNGFALSFVLSYAGEKQGLELTRVLDKVKLD